MASITINDLVSNPELNGLLGHSSSFCQSVRHGKVCHADSGLRVRVLIGVCLLELSHQESSNQSRGDRGARGTHPSNQNLRVMMPSCDHLIWHACCHDVVRCFSNAYRYCNEVLGSHGNSLEKNAERKGQLLFHVVRFLCSAFQCLYFEFCFQSSSDFGAVLSPINVWTAEAATSLPRLSEARISRTETV